MNTELPDDVLLAGGEVVPVPRVPLNPFDFLGFALQMQIRICESRVGNLTACVVPARTGEGS
jgi:hypothetical protein